MNQTAIKLQHPDGTRCAGDTCAWKGDRGHSIRYRVEVLRMVTTTVDVDADSPEKAVEAVSMQDFDLPTLDEWQGLDGWEYAVYDHAGNELHRQER